MADFKWEQNLKKRDVTCINLIGKAIRRFCHNAAVIFWGGGGRNSPQLARVSSFTRLLHVDNTQRRITVGRNPLAELSARRKDLYLTTHNRKTSMPKVEFEPTISAGERSQTSALDSAATGTGNAAVITIYLLK